MCGKPHQAGQERFRVDRGRVEAASGYGLLPVCRDDLLAVMSPLSDLLGGRDDLLAVMSPLSDLLGGRDDLLVVIAALTNSCGDRDDLLAVMAPLSDLLGGSDDLLAGIHAGLMRLPWNKGDRQRDQIVI